MIKIFSMITKNYLKLINLEIKDLEQEIIGHKKKEKKAMISENK